MGRKGVLEKKRKEKIEKNNKKKMKTQSRHCTREKYQ